MNILRVYLALALAPVTLCNNLAALQSTAAAIVARLEIKCGPPQDSCSASEKLNLENAKVVVEVANLATSPEPADWARLLTAVRSENVTIDNGDFDAWSDMYLGKDLTNDDYTLLEYLASNGTNMVQLEDDDSKHDEQPAEFNTEGGDDFSRYQLGDGTPWPNRELKYTWHPDIGSSARGALITAMEEIEARSCVKHTEVPADHTDRFTTYRDDEPGCYSNVGYHKGSTNLDKGCRSHATALHEILHAWGMAHEQSRPDRDMFLEVKWENIQEKAEHNFEIREKGYTGAGYDYGSIMHYAWGSFSDDYISTDMLGSWTYAQIMEVGLNAGKATLLPRNRKFLEVAGHSGTMSAGDVLQLLDMYDCKKYTPKSEQRMGVESFFSWLGSSDVTDMETASCPTGYVAAGCTCWQEDGKCYGGVFGESDQQICQASAPGGSSGLRAYTSCLKLSSAYYSLNPLSRGEDKEAEAACPGTYMLVGCSCISNDKTGCGAIPDTTAKTCKAVSDGRVFAQANCLRAPGVESVQTLTSSEGADVEAICPEDQELLGCSCGNQDCQGARATGTGQRHCTAEAVSGKTTTAIAICGKLLTDVEVPNPVGKHLLDGFFSMETTYSDWIKDKDGGMRDLTMPVQSMFCDANLRRPDIEGCFAVRLKWRSTAAYDCSRHSCKEVEIHTKLDATQKKEFKLNGGQAGCPTGWVVVDVHCYDDCEELSVSCAPPQIDAPWYLSGAISYTDWFSGESNNAYGTCVHGLAVGLQCSPTDGSQTALGKAYGLGETCNKVRMVCRRVALQAGDDTEQRGIFDLALTDGGWSKSVSSTGANEKVTKFDFKDDGRLINDNYHPIQQVKCENAYCDDLSFFVPIKFGSPLWSLNLTGSPTVYTVQIEGEGELTCPQGHFVAGMLCENSFCEKKRFLCAIPAEQAWIVSGSDYYSHCFTNDVKYSWNEWYRSVKESIRGKERSCLTSSANDMPDQQSCGIDGILVGMRCYGKHCDKAQLVCRTVDVGSGGRLQELEAAGLYNNPEKWTTPPANDQAVETHIWDGEKLVEYDATLLVSSAERSVATAGLIFAVMAFIATAL